MSLFSHILAFLLGALLVYTTLLSAVKTFVLPRSAPDLISTFVFRHLRRLFNLGLKPSRPYVRRDALLAYYAPVATLLLLLVWIGLLITGYTALYWSLGNLSWYAAFRASGSALLTLGFASPEGLPRTILEFTQAAFGLILIALLIAYLPTMYSAFARREAAVTLLEVRAGSPPSATEMLKRFYRIHGLDQLGEQWKLWEVWFADIEESHTSLAALVFFRSPRAEHSWVTSAGAILDTAALTLAAVDIPHDSKADLCLRAGYLALRHIGEFFGLTYRANPHFGDPISIRQEEFEAALDILAAAGLPLKADRQQAWKDYAGWRVNYDEVLLQLAKMTMAPEAPWISEAVRLKD